MPVQYTKKGDFRVYNAISELKEKVAGALLWLLRFFVERTMFVLKASNTCTGEPIAILKVSSLSKVNPAAQKIWEINDCDSDEILFQVFHDSDLNLIEEFYIPKKDI